MTTSTKFGVPYLSQAQASPEIKHNAALYMIEALLRGVKDILTAPPGAPVDGDSYLIVGVGSGAWLNRDNHVAIWAETQWIFIPGFDSDGSIIPPGTAHEGMTVYVQDENAWYRWTGTTWSNVTQDPALTVGTLPAAATFPRGRAFVTDSNQALTAGIGAVVAGGGANIVPVHSDGTNWRIG